LKFVKVSSISRFRHTIDTIYHENTGYLSLSHNTSVEYLPLVVLDEHFAAPRAKKQGHPRPRAGQPDADGRIGSARFCA
jgi:hypothetical protein